MAHEWLNSHTVFPRTIQMVYICTYNWVKAVTHLLGAYLRPDSLMLSHHDNLNTPGNKTKQPPPKKNSLNNTVEPFKKKKNHHVPVLCSTCAKRVGAAVVGLKEGVDKPEPDSRCTTLVGI